MSPKKKEKMLALFAEGLRGVQVAKRLNIDPKVIYYHQNKFLGKAPKDKKEVTAKKYIKAIGPDKPNLKKQIGVALIIIGEQITAIGRALRGDHSV